MCLENRKFIKAKTLPLSTNKALISYADEVLDSIKVSRYKKGAVCAIQYNDIYFLCKSCKNIKRGRFPKLHPLLFDYILHQWKTVELLKAKPFRSWQHGKCAEVNALNKLLYYLEKKHGKLT